MRIKLCTLAIFLTLGSVQVHAQARSRRPPQALAASTEMIVVTTVDWNAAGGTLQRYQRSNLHEKWTPVGAPVSVVVGKNGLGWGSGLVAIDDDDSRIRVAADPVKKEGDGKAPAGIFALSQAFGYAPQAAGWKMPYLPLSPSVECVDDSASKFYNRVLDRGSVAPDWNSSEHMRRTDDLYLWGIVVDYNNHPALPGAGSCIFMHIWRGPSQGTAGCTAMPQEQLKSILAWLDPGRKPLLVQLPRAAYASTKKRWGLPALR